MELMVSCQPSINLQGHRIVIVIVSEHGGLHGYQSGRYIKFVTLEFRELPLRFDFKESVWLVDVD
jgi:hypothetical protein